MKNGGGIRKRKVERVTEYILNALLPLPGGGKLPSIRTIMEKTGAGRLAVYHALDSLRKAGLIRIEPGSGIYRIGEEGQHNEIRLIHFRRETIDLASEFSVDIRFIINDA